MEEGIEEELAEEEEAEEDLTDEVEAPFRLKYDGPEYQGEMSARELAGVLTNLSDFVEAVEGADALAGQQGARVTVKAFGEGSFEILAALVLVTKGVSAAAVVGALMGAFRFYWRNMRRRVVNYEIDDARQMVRVTFLDRGMEEWTLEEWRLYSSERAKKSIKGIVAPLRRGATKMEITGGREEPIVVPAERVNEFRAAPPLPDPGLPGP